MKHLTKVFIKSLAFRAISIFIIQTYFVPDEYWQSLEPAHVSVFGFGYLTWEFNEFVRSWTYPFFFAAIYKALVILNVDYQLCIVYFPRIFQATLTAFADCCYYKLCRRLGISSHYIWKSILFDWFLFYCGSRTLINMFESNLVCFGLAIDSDCLPVKIVPERHRRLLFFVLVSLICFIRPTACLIWGPFCFLQLLNVKMKSQYLVSFLLTGVFTCSLLIGLDSFLYGCFVITPLNFLNVNFINDISHFYGSHPWHWYLTQGLPVVLGVQMIPFLMQFWDSLKSLVSKRRIPDDLNSSLCFSIAVSLVAYSLVPHKEFRFILPCAPMMNLLAIQKSRRLFNAQTRIIYQCAQILGFVIPVIVFGLLHQRGSLAIMDHLKYATDNSSQLLFLTPCHSTPLYSHLHVNITTRFITCEPPISPYHHDESEVFFSDPNNWLEQYFVYNQPSHVIMFDNLSKLISEQLLARNYKLDATIFHTIFPEGRIGSYIELYRYQLQ